MHFVRLLVVDADAHDIEVHDGTQLAREKPEEFSEDRIEMRVCETRKRASYREVVAVLAGFGGCRSSASALRFDNISHRFQTLEA